MVDSWSHLRKLEAVSLYRRYGVSSEGITVRELRQWDIIHRHHPEARLQIRRLTVLDLRVAPKPATSIAALTLPQMSPQRQRLCASVAALTEAEGICTPADLSHSLWGTAPRPLSTEVFDVQVCVINAILRKHHFARRIERIRGRGFQWVEE